jgi:hypothetical protein
LLQILPEAILKFIISVDHGGVQARVIRYTENDLILTLPLQNCAIQTLIAHA